MSDILVDPADRCRGLVVVADVTHQLARKVCYAALAELGLELELSGWALASGRTRDRMDPAAQTELVALLSGVRRLPIKEAKILSEEQKAVLLVVIGYRLVGAQELRQRLRLVAKRSELARLASVAVAPPIRPVELHHRYNGIKIEWNFCRI